MPQTAVRPPRVADADAHERYLRRCRWVLRARWARSHKFTSVLVLVAIF